MVEVNRDHGLGEHCDHGLGSGFYVSKGVTSTMVEVRTATMVEVTPFQWSRSVFATMANVCVCQHGQGMFLIKCSRYVFGSWSSLGFETMVEVRLLLRSWFQKHTRSGSQTHRSAI